VSREKEGKKKEHDSETQKGGEKEKKEGGTKSDRGKLKKREQRW
jgi:hypothetical protein